jgi:hypothetical protein
MNRLKNIQSEAVIPLRGPHNHQNILKLSKELVPGWVKKGIRDNSFVGPNILLNSNSGALPTQVRSA